jgi:hypothetical protein
VVTEFKGGFLTAELWQFAIFIGAFLVVALLWLCIIYLPGRTMEYWVARGTMSREGDGGTPRNSD